MPATCILADIEERFRKSLLRRLNQAERLSDAFMNKLLQWNLSGFSVHPDPPSPRLRRVGQLVFDNEPERLEKLVSYLTRAPIRLGSITETPEGRVLLRTPPHPLTGNTLLVLDAFGCYL